MLWISSYEYQPARYNQLCIIHVTFLTCKYTDFQGLLSSRPLLLAHFHFIFLGNKMSFALCLSLQNLKGGVFFSGFLNVILPGIECYNIY